MIVSYLLSSRCEYQVYVSHLKLGEETSQHVKCPIRMVLESSFKILSGRYQAFMMDPHHSSKATARRSQSRSATSVVDVLRPPSKTAPNVIKVLIYTIIIINL